MLKAKLESYDNLTSSLKPLKIIGKAKADITENSIKFCGVNDSNTLFMELNLNKSRFKDFKINPKSLSVCMEVNDFLNALSRTSGSNLEIDDKQIRLSDEDKKIILPLYDNDEVRDLPENLELNFENALSVSSKKLKKAVKDIMTIFQKQSSFGYSSSDSVRLKINNKEIVLSYKEGMKEINIRVEGNKQGLDKFEKITKEVNLLVSVDLLEQAVKYLDDMLRVYVGKNTPLKLETDNYKVIIAPRVENSDFDDETDYSDEEKEESDEVTTEYEPQADVLGDGSIEVEKKENE